MPTVTFDSRSFMLDGRRIWIVGGSVSYTHIPREQWADSLHAARLCGLNTVLVPVMWARHEPLPGQFDFSGDADLRAFIEMAHAAGLYVILRLGPSLDDDHDFGGLPSWLTGLPAHELRSNSGQFLEACSRYITAVADQIRDLQINAVGKGGPIVLIQNEHLWTCGDADLAPGYLGELYRYIRESGLSVPVVNANNLWSGVEGEIDCWVGQEDLLATLRQLSEVRPDHPRMVLDLRGAEPAVWGVKSDPPDGRLLLRRIVEVLAGAGQFSLGRFAPGFHAGFGGGRLGGRPDGFAATDRGGLIDPAGRATPAAMMARRACMFAGAFARTLGHLSPEIRPIVLHPEQTSREARGQLSIVQLTGANGEVAFVFDPAGGKTKTSATLLLADGTTLPITVGEQGVAWLLNGVRLTGKHILDYTNLSVLTMAGSTLVLFGPASSEGVVCINGSPLSVTVPRGKWPQALRHEGVLVVVCSEAQADECFPHDGRVYCGVAGVSQRGEPIAAPGAKSYQVIDAGGEAKTHSFDPPPKAPRRLSPSWALATTEDYCQGGSAKYASIDGPADLATLGAPSGYGWYRLTGRFGGESGSLALPEAADRLHLFLDGKPLGLLGDGPGTGPTIQASLPKGEASLVVLADNMGRAASGILLGERKGVFGHLFELSPLEVTGPELEVGPPMDMLAFRSPMWNVHQNDHTAPYLFKWSFTHRRKSPLFLSVGGGLGRGLVVLNEEPIACFDDAGFSGLRLETEELKRGANILHIALHDDGLCGPTSEEEGRAMLPTLAQALALNEGRAELTTKADWAFAKWEQPAPASFQPVAKAQLKAQQTPAWWRATFEAGDTDAPLHADLAGMTKGQAYLNGRHLGRYFVQTASRKATHAEQRLHLPGPWLIRGGRNELTLFDEHGAAPSKVKLAYDEPAGVLRA